MIHNLFTLLEWIKVNLARRLNPFIEEVRGKLIFFFHKNIKWAFMFVLILLRNLFEIISYQLVIVSFSHQNFSSFCFTIIFLKVHIIKSRVSKNRKFLTQPLAIPIINPFMFFTMALKLTLQPRIQRSKMIFDAMVESGLKFIWVKYLNYSFLPSRTNRLTFSHINLNMNHTVRKRF